MNNHLEQIIKDRAERADFELIRKSFSGKKFASGFFPLPENTESVQFSVLKGAERSIRIDSNNVSRGNYYSFTAEYEVCGCFVISGEDSIPKISEEVNFKVLYQGFISHPEGQVIESGIFRKTD